MFSIIKNAQAVDKETVVLPYSKLKYEIVKILERENYIKKGERKKRKTKKIIQIFLKYKDKMPAISEIRKVSKPGQRIYLPAREIKKVKGGFGLAIISTSKGLLTDREARKQKIGGEVICQVW